MRTQAGFSGNTPSNAPNTSRRDESPPQSQPMTATGKTGQTEAILKGFLICLSVGILSFMKFSDIRQTE